MKITGGTLKGRDIAQPSSETTRPMTGRATEALFNMLGDITDLSVLDLYAGSGVLGIEAVSRGARTVTAVERDRGAVEVLRNNYTDLGIEEYVDVQVQPVQLWAVHNKATFDLVFADPPFDDFDETPLEQLAAKACNVFMTRHSSHHQTPELAGMVLRRQRRYGNSVLCIYTPDA